jgi:hypothetical protein
MHSRLAIVALSAQPPGVNELCVCVYIPKPHPQNVNSVEIVASYAMDTPCPDVLVLYLANNNKIISRYPNR